MKGLVLGLMVWFRMVRFGVSSFRAGYVLWPRLGSGTEVVKRETLNFRGPKP